MNDYQTWITGSELITRPPDGFISQRWSELDGKRTSILTNAEQYAAWTIPTIFPRDEDEEFVELQNDFQSVGAQAATHMANVLTTTLMPPQRPFFRIDIGDDTMKKLEDAKVDPMAVDNAAAASEQAAIGIAETWRTRPALMRASELLVVTGNALMYKPFGAHENEPMQTYSMRNYVIRRDVFGNPVEIITRDRKDLRSFDESTRAKIMAARPAEKRSDLDVHLYTGIFLRDNRFYIYQAAEEHTLDVEGSYPKNKLPYLPLTWRLVEGENYGRGLVESYAGDFNALSVLSQSLVEGAAIMADIKWLVNPMGSTDVDELNATPSGTYVSGMIDDIRAVQLEKSQDFTWVMQFAAQYERRIGQAFMLATAVQRDAERVTAEEIRMMVRELDKGHGGVYAILTDTFQLPFANLLLEEVGFKIKGADDVKPVITTGVDSLARDTQAENLKLMFNDISIINNLPESFQARLKEDEVMSDFANARGLSATKYMKTDEEMEQERKDAMMMQAAQEKLSAVAQGGQQPQQPVQQ